MAKAFDGGDSAGGDASDSGDAPVNGARIHYEVAGEGPPLVLVHAGVADRRMWDDQFAVFARFFRTVRFDLRGYGLTRAPAEPFAHYEDLFGLLRYLGIETAHVVGLSLGGSVGLELALAHPEVVSALVLAAAAPPGFERSENTRRGWAEGNAALERGDVTRAIEIDLEMWLDGPRRTAAQVDPGVRARIREWVAATYAVPGELGTERHLEPPALARLGEVRAPTLIVVGDLDMPEMLPAADRLGREIPNARKVVIPGAAHMVNVEYPEDFNRAVLDFLNA